ncbi:MULTISPECIES: DUF3566 domain-containing protein [unclassified Solwaraspora]|uniref:DUF3566 domain-containing protein n=1 Tax=unclassified Solwaraspora TaxID=2627926 RepID=UPI00259B680D|nr:DUF3566 domain-containing protein [Solwaraspora sp. WMMA2056]WJK41735.1 DUF3566 domain-containing protein [Solwaraspora sp. WMMA2056]
MTETQAKSGATGASAAPVDEESAAGGPATATGRAAVGRASVPADSPAPKFTRAPGMPPPPDKPADDPGSDAGAEDGSARAGGTGDRATGGALTLGGGAASSGRSATPVTSAPPVSSAPPASSGSGFTGGALGATAASGTATRPGLGVGSTQPLGTVGGTKTGSAPGSRSGLGSPTVRTVGAAGTAAAGSAAVGAARVGGDGARTARPGVSSAASRGPRRARLNLKRIDPWSVMKFSFAVSLVLFIVVIVATSVLYLALDAMGVFESVNTSLGDLIGTGTGEGPTFRVTAQGVIGSAALFGLVNVVLYTALATLGAFIYNVCADLVGGIELTLAERD